MERSFALLLKYHHRAAACRAPRVVNYSQGGNRILTQSKLMRDQTKPQLRTVQGPPQEHEEMAECRDNTRWTDGRTDAPVQR